MRSSFARSASRTSIRFCSTHREAGQGRRYQFAPEVSRRSSGAKLPSSWQGQQYLETRPWSTVLWADCEGTMAQGRTSTPADSELVLPTLLGHSRGQVWRRS
jgi:hypothetical protein